MGCGCGGRKDVPRPQAQTNFPVRQAPPSLPQQRAQGAAPLVPSSSGTCWKCKGVLQLVRPVGRMPEYLKCRGCGAIFAKGR
jgi:hypothetical protein